MSCNEILTANVTFTSIDFTFCGRIMGIMMLAYIIIQVALSILNARKSKPYKNRYPYEEFKSFEDFIQKRPADPYKTGNASLITPKRLREREQKFKELPVLTWDNLSALDQPISEKQKSGDVKSESNGKSHRSSTNGNMLRQNLEEDHVPDHIKEMEQKLKATPILTWDNISEISNTCTVK
jgi:hypothetical protein